MATCAHALPGATRVVGPVDDPARLFWTINRAQKSRDYAYVGAFPWRARAGPVGGRKLLLFRLSVRVCSRRRAEVLPSGKKLSTRLAQQMALSICAGRRAVSVRTL